MNNRPFVNEADLQYMSDTVPGIRRVKAGRGFLYLSPTGKKITDERELERIRKLGIPPAWHDVWISPLAQGHIQATGRDERGRKQYRYHQDWIAKSQEHKFSKMYAFGQRLDALRRRVEADMKSPALKRQQVLGTIVWLLDHTYIRIGNPEYAKENKHVGLTTMRDENVQVAGANIMFAFTGKSGKQSFVEVSHPRVAKTIRKLEELPGYELFQYMDNGQLHTVHSQEVNEYLREVSGEAVSAKDFRTWGGSVFAAVSLYNLGQPENKMQAKKNISRSVKEVAKHLRNTPAVARKYYIHPKIPARYSQQLLIPHFDMVRQEHQEKPKYLHVDEYALLCLFKDQ